MSKKMQLLIPGSVLFLILIVYLSYQFAYAGRLYPGVGIVGLPTVGNLTREQAVSAINSQLPAQHTITLVNSDQKWEINLDDCDLHYQPEVTVEKAYRLGRSGNLLVDLKEKKSLWLSGKELLLDYQFNEDNLREKIATIASQINQPSIPASIEMRDNQIMIDKGSAGKEIDQDELKSLVKQKISTINFSTLDIPLKDLSAPITDEQATLTKNRAEVFLSKKLIITANNTRFELTGGELIKFLSFTNGYDQTNIKDWLENIATSIDQPPQNPLFQFADGRVAEFQPAKEGKKLDREKSLDVFAQALIALEAQPLEKEITLPVVTTAPPITTAEVNNLGIQTLLGQGASYFRGSIASRIHNVNLAASKINGLIIPPGNTFSFNTGLGDVSNVTGFQPAYIIKEGRTVLGDGGGVCQVSTTLFRAALMSGLPIIERHAHAYRVSYYEQKAEVGQDATVFSPTSDLRIQNDTPAHILIQTAIDPKELQLTISLYGTSDGRQVSLSKSKIWDQTPPPPDLYQDDPTLAAGIVKQVDWKAWGAKVSFSWKVTRNDEVLQERTFYSNYKPWQAIFLRGTKTN